MTTIANNPVPELTLGDARSRLMRLWRWSLFPFVFVIVQTVGGKYGRTWPDMLDGLWWVLPLIGPLLGVMYGTSRAIQPSNARSRAPCNVELFRHCRWLSAIFIFAITATVVFEPWLILWKSKELLTLSNIILQPLSAWLTGVLMVFFLSE
jgi:uncharacterized membrane protein